MYTYSDCFTSCCARPGKDSRATIEVFMTRPRSDSTTPRRKQRRLTKELIVDASIRCLRRVGSKKFSVRAVAKELDVTPMAIYRHVPSKEALIEDVRQSLLSLVPI